MSFLIGFLIGYNFRLLTNFLQSFLWPVYLILSIDVNFNLTPLWLRKLCFYHKYFFLKNAKFVYFILNLVKWKEF